MEGKSTLGSYPYNMYYNQKGDFLQVDVYILALSISRKLWTQSNVTNFGNASKD